MKKALFLLFTAILSSSCGNQSLDESDSKVEARHDLIGPHKEIIEPKSSQPSSLEDVGFKKCQNAYVKFSGQHHKNLQKVLEGRYVNHVFFNGGLVFEEGLFVDNFKDLEFNENDPCSQIKMFFAGYSFTGGYIRMSLGLDTIKKLMANNQKSGLMSISHFDNIIMSFSNVFTSDNITRLPSHMLKIKIQCQSGLNISCSVVDNKCDFSKEIRAEFPNDECTIEGVDQVFALYPKGNVRINFKGKLKKISDGGEGMDNMELTFSDVEWK